MIIQFKVEDKINYELQEMFNAFSEDRDSPVVRESLINIMGIVSSDGRLTIQYVKGFKYKTDDPLLVNGRINVLILEKLGLI